jgi:hypothetical protein
LFEIRIYSYRLHDDCKALQNEIGDLKKQIVRRRKRLRSLRPKLKQVVKVENILLIIFIRRKKLRILSQQIQFVDILNLNSTIQTIFHNQLIIH